MVFPGSRPQRGWSGEAGVRVVTVCTGTRYDQGWDTHRDHFPLLKRSLLPMFDRGFSAFLADLADRGLLETTLVAAMGEFGRTPKAGQITSSAGADKGGRDWPHCSTVLLAGGGLPAGAIHGASDPHAAYPAEDPVTPPDPAATIDRAMGLDPDDLIRDHLDRPFPLSAGTPIRVLIGQDLLTAINFPQLATMRAAREPGRPSPTPGPARPIAVERRTQFAAGPGHFPRTPGAPHRPPSQPSGKPGKDESSSRSRPPETSCHDHRLGHPTP